MSIERRIKIQVKGKSHSFFAIYPPGFEDIGQQELQQAGISQIDAVETGGILFTAKLPQMMQAVLSCHGAIRILMRLDSFKATNFSMLMRHLENDIPWELYLPAKCLPNFSISCTKSRLYHSDAVAERAKKALASIMGEDATPQDQTVYLRLVNDRCTVSLDCCGEPLFRRGYKQYTAEAPLRENLASLLLTRVIQHEPHISYAAVYDPMCGCGTFLTEAATWNGQMQQKEASLRSFAFQKWPAYSEAAFHYLVRQPSPWKNISLFEKEPQIFGSDINHENVNLTMENAKKLGLSCYTEFSSSHENNLAIHLICQDFFQTNRIQIPIEGKLLLLINPPYGKRLKIDKKLFYSQLGQHLKQNYKGCDVLILVPDEESEKALGLHYDKKWNFRNGGLSISALFMHL